MFGTYRVFLALMVVASHLGGIPRIGAYAVFGFYCLSGYLMTLIMKVNYGYTVRGCVKYAANRFLRIYPIYWASILLSSVLVFFLGSQYVSSYHESMYFPETFSELTKNIFIFFPFRENPRLTPPAWALTVEIVFYILIGAGLSKTKSITLLWFLFGVVYHLLAAILQLGWEYRYFTVFAASLPFSTGALIFHYKEDIIRFIKNKSGEMHPYLPCILLCLMLANWLLGYKFGQLSGAFFYVNFFLCSLMVAVLSNRKELCMLDARLDGWLGGLSYPIYLFHYQVGIIVIVLFSVLGVELVRPSLTLMIASIPFIFVLSWVVSVALEGPIEIIRSKVKS